MNRVLAVLMALGLVALLAACATEPTATSVPPTRVPPTATPEAMMMEAPEDVLLIALNALNSSGQNGWAMLTAKGAQTEVVLSLSAGAMESDLVHIHTGPCGPTLGRVDYDLTSFAADGASSTTVAATLASLRTGGFAINAHQKGNAGVYTACGVIPAAPAASQAPAVPISEEATSSKSDASGKSDAPGY